MKAVIRKGRLASLIALALVLSLIPVLVSAQAVEIDYMEYSSNALAQAAYVTNGAYGNTGDTITTDGLYTVHTFTANGTFTPIRSGAVSVQCWGGGGGGGYSSSSGGGGGGGGAYAATPDVAVTAGTGYAVVVGVGGGRDAAPSATKSTFAATIVVADLGISSTDETGVLGGLVDNCVGTTKYKGGDGKNGNTTGDTGGGGGGAGGPDGAGGDGTAAAPNLGGAGGRGDNNLGGLGGVVPGGNGGNDALRGGGGGAGNSVAKGTGGNGGFPGGAGAGTDSTSGAAGAAGQVIVRCLTSDYLSLQSYSEATIKTQGTYSLKGVATITASLNKTLTKTTSKNLTGVNTLKFDIYSSRTGSNIKIGIRDTGGTTTEITPSITSAGAWQTVTWDISAVSDANKDAIDSIIVTIVNADVANTFYIDNFYAAATFDITNTPAEKAFGTVAASSTYYAKGTAPSNPVLDEDCIFTLTNAGNVAINVSIKGSAFTGGAGWTLTSDSPGSNTVRITAYRSGIDPATGVVLTTSNQAFISNLGVSGTKKWDFKFETGTFTDGEPKSGTITLTSTVY